MRSIFVNLLFILGSCYSSICFSLTFPISSDSDIVGAVQEIKIQRGETLFSIARKFDLGLLELLEANPKLNPNKVATGSVIILPTAFILPPGPREGIVINLAELRVYYYHPGNKLVSTHPVGIGRIGWKTPVGETKIVRKKVNPTWIPPKSIRAHYARKGKKLPYSIGPGPNNPLGGFAMYLGWNKYLMHGTNQPTSIGKRSSSGCIRMYPEDIEALFNIVPKGTKVRVIHEPFKVGSKNGKVYLEAHQPFTERYYGNKDDDDVLDTIDDDYYNIKSKINWLNAKTEMKQTIGYPISIMH